MQHNQEFLQLINKLETDKFFAITVIDLTNGKEIIKNNDKAAIVRKSGSLEDFFNGIFSEGVSEIGVRTKRKNGSSWIDGVEPFLKIRLGGNAPTAPASMQGLNGSLLSPEILKMQVDASKYADLKERNAILEAQNEKYRKKVNKFDKKKMVWENSKTPSPLMSELIQHGMPHIDKLAGVLAQFGIKLPGAAAGLSNPNLSQTKTSLIQVLETCSELNADILADVYERLPNDKFVNALDELVKTYPLDNAS